MQHISNNFIILFFFFFFFFFFFCNDYHIILPGQLMHVATDRNRSLPGKALVPYTIGAQHHFKLTGTKIGVELGTRM
jgi:hypothetical protein